MTIWMDLEAWSVIISSRFLVKLMWRLVWGNVLRFLGMFKDSHVLLQIMLGNQMPEESRFPL